MAAKQALQKAFDPIWNWASRRYQAAVAKELKKYGLRYDDLYDDLYDLDIKEALSRLPQEEVDLRNQRLKRAMDYSMKHQYLPKELQCLTWCSRGPPSGSVRSSTGRMFLTRVDSCIKIDGTGIQSSFVIYISDFSLNFANIVHLSCCRQSKLRTSPICKMLCSWSRKNEGNTQNWDPTCPTHVLYLEA